MSGNRPSLAGAFAPVTTRGAKLEGMLAPKRKRDETPSNTGTTRPLGSSHIAVVPEPLAGPELANAPTKIIGSETDNDGGGVADTPRKSTAAKASPSAAPNLSRTLKRLLTLMRRLPRPFWEHRVMWVCTWHPNF
jgi:hypothetical protein